MAELQQDLRATKDAADLQKRELKTEVRDLKAMYQKCAQLLISQSEELDHLVSRLCDEQYCVDLVLDDSRYNLPFLDDGVEGAYLGKVFSVWKSHVLAGTVFKENVLDGQYHHNTPTSPENVSDQICPDLPKLADGRASESN